MDFFREFIWNTDHYAYHITNTDAMKNICKEGLKPSVGKRSLKAGDNIKGIFFFDGLIFMNEWIDFLYEDKNILELELLRFNIKKLKWTIHNSNEFYITNDVNQKEIEYLRLFDKDTNAFLPLNTEYYLTTTDERITWNKLNNYKPLIKSIKK